MSWRGIKYYIASKLAPQITQLEHLQEELHSYQHLLPRVVDPTIVQESLRQSLSTKGEIKEISVMFTDLRGFTSFSEQTSLRATSSLLNNFYDMVISHTQMQGGMIDKFMGDGSMSIFTADNGSNHALAAVKAAQAIVKDFTSMTSQSHEPDLHIGVGIATGPALVGFFGNGDYVSFTALGSIVNLAARIQGAAENDNILVTAGTANELPEELLNYYGRKEFKNVSKRVDLYEIK